MVALQTIHDASTPSMQETADMSGHDEEQEREKEPLVVIPYVAGMSEDIRRVCRKFNIRVVYLGKQSNVVYHPLQLRPGLHWGDQMETGDKAEGNRDACERGMMEKSAVAEHAWENHHPIDWEETTVLDDSRGQELLEALHIQMTPSEERFNRDGGLEVPCCWIAVMRQGR